MAEKKGIKNDRLFVNDQSGVTPDKKELREELKNAVEEFKRNGGQITRINTPRELEQVYRGIRLKGSKPIKGKMK